MVVKEQIYEYSDIPSIDGGFIHFNDYKGKKILLVNLDTYGEYSPQYVQLEKLYKKYKDKAVVIGFPANNYGREEPGSTNELSKTFRKKYGLTFPIADRKMNTDESVHPIQRWLASRKENGFPTDQKSWHFQKYLIDEFGKLIAIFPPGKEPLHPDVIEAIEKPSNKGENFY